MPSSGQPRPCPSGCGLVDAGRDGGHVARSLADGAVLLSGRLRTTGSARSARRSRFDVRVSNSTGKNGGVGSPDLAARIGLGTGPAEMDAAGEICGRCRQHRGAGSRRWPSRSRCWRGVQRQVASLLVAEERSTRALKVVPVPGRAGRARAAAAGRSEPGERARSGASLNRPSRLSAPPSPSRGRQKAELRAAHGVRAGNTLHSADRPADADPLPAPALAGFSATPEFPRSNGRKCPSPRAPDQALRDIDRFGHLRFWQVWNCLCWPGQSGFRGFRTVRTVRATRRHGGRQVDIAATDLLAGHILIRPAFEARFLKILIWEHRGDKAPASRVGRRVRTRVIIMRACRLWRSMPRPACFRHGVGVGDA